MTLALALLELRCIRGRSGERAAARRRRTDIQ